MMRLKSVSIDNLLSFQLFGWPAFDSHLNVIVGPNGAGKTNLFRAIRLAVGALSIDQRPTISRGLLHHGDTSNCILIVLDLELNGAWEQELLRSFIAAALCDKSALHSSAAPDESGQPKGYFDEAGRELVSALLHTRLRPEHIAPFLRGRLIVRREPSGEWRSNYHSLPGDPFYDWEIEGTQISALAGQADPDEQFRPLIDILRIGMSTKHARIWNEYVDGLSEEAPPVPDLAEGLRELKQRVVVGVDLSNAAMPTWTCSSNR